jgi:hypothetical protein
MSIRARKYLTLTVLVLTSLLTVTAYQNCSEFTPSPELLSSQSGSSVTPPIPEPDPVPGPPPANKKVVSIGVGIGGRRVSGLGGFAQVLGQHGDITMAYQRQVVAATASTPAQCPAGTTLMPYISGQACCFSQYQCFEASPGSWHSDFIYRGIAFGNGRAVAVGGWLYGIVSFTDDGGKTWSPKYDLLTQNGLLTGNRTQANYLGGVAYGKGKWVALQGYGGELLTSTDAIHWVTKSGPAIATKTFRRIYFIDDMFYSSGDNGVWAVSDDGETWTVVGQTGGVEALIKAKGAYYGLSNGVVMKSTDLKTGTWTQVGTLGVPAANLPNSLVYMPATDSLLALGGGYISKTTGDFSTWETLRPTTQMPGRWMHFNGEQIVGDMGSPGYSSDVMNWAKPAADPNFDQPFWIFASGLVDESKLD